MSNFQVWYNGTKINTAQIQFDPRYQFLIVLPNNNANDTYVKFTFQGIVTRVAIRTPRDEYLDTLAIYEITSPILWDPMSKLHAENEESVHQGAAIKHRGEMHGKRGGVQMRDPECQSPIHMIRVYRQLVDANVALICYLFIIF